MRAYSSDEAKNSIWSLPDIEYWMDEKSNWLWWYCLPGCMPDSDPFGPFNLESECIENFNSISEI